MTTTWLKEASAAQTVVSVHMIYKPQSKCRPKHLRIYFMELRVACKKDRTADALLVLLLRICRTRGALLVTVL